MSLVLTLFFNQLRHSTKTRGVDNLKVRSQKKAGKKKSEARPGDRNQHSVGSDLKVTYAVYFLLDDFSGVLAADIDRCSPAKASEERNRRTPCQTNGTPNLPLFLFIYTITCTKYHTC
jgi:hypothetical protein